MKSLINIYKNDARDERGDEKRRDDISERERQFFILRPVFTARVTPRVHRVAQFVRAAKRADNERNKDGYERFYSGKYIPALEVRTPCFLRADYSVGFVREGGNKSQRNGHNEREIMNGKFNEVERFQQTFDSVRKAHGRGGQR